jgi:hypothetical protein
MSKLFADVFSALLGIGNFAEPPDSVPLRLLGLEAIPATHAAINDAFRRRVMELHPDTAAYSASPDLAADALTSAEADATVQEAMWARDILFGKVHDATAEKSHSRESFSSRGW